MSDYSKATNFTSKDALVSGDPLKVVRGTEIDVEFDAIQTSVATKADKAGPTFTGSVTIPTATAGDSSTLAASTAFVASVLRFYIQGLVISNGPVDLVNDIQISAGTATDAGGTATMFLSSALIKQLDANWAVGTNAGGLDTGSIGNSDYYLWLIKRPDTGVVDALFSLSSTAPTMPTNYTLKRLVGWIKRVGGAIVLFTTYEIAGGGLRLRWASPTVDINLANTLTTARRTDPVKVPLNFAVSALLNVHVLDATTGGVAWIYCPDQTDLAPSVTVAPLANASWTTTASFNAQMEMQTSATGTIAARSTIATTDEYFVATLGFDWARRN